MIKELMKKCDIGKETTQKDLLMSMLNLNEASLIDFNGPEPRKFKTDLQLPVT
jgi:hypothetical protein